MNESRELDCLVAEKILGYRVQITKPDWYDREVWLFFDDEFPGIIRYTWDSNACNARMNMDQKDPKKGAADPLPFYSSEEDEDNTNQVIITRMIRHHSCHFRMMGFTQPRNKSGLEYEVEFLPKGKPMPNLVSLRHLGTADNMTHAILEAALKVVTKVEEKVKEKEA